ncbi:hypothetical protein HKX48_000633, partial [Thoreauomyces humboldtii]
KEHLEDVINALKSDPVLACLPDDIRKETMRSVLKDICEELSLTVVSEKIEAMTPKSDKVKKTRGRPKKVSEKKDQADDSEERITFDPKTLFEK